MNLRAIKDASRRQVTLFTLVELLVICVFISVLFAFAVAREGRENSSRLEELLARERQLNSELNELVGNLRIELRRVTDERDRYRRLYLQLIEGFEGTLPTSPDELERVTLVSLDDYRDLASEAEALGGLAAEQQRQIDSLRGQLRGLGGTSAYPNCLVSSGFLLKINLHDNGRVSAESRWPPSRAQVARDVDGAIELIEAGEISILRFRNLSRRVFEWGRGQSVPCVFRVDTELMHSDLEVYREQMAAVDAYFYPRRY